MGGTIRKLDWMFNNEYALGTVDWNTININHLIDKARNKQTAYYGMTDTLLYRCLSKFPIDGKSIAIIGSFTPWYECICLAYKGIPTTIEYNKIKCDDKRLQTITVNEYDKNPKSFDAVISISSIEHDGLGRYGDSINPDGDLEVMQKIKNQILKKNGILYLAVPTGFDSVCWNAHRIYGKRRWPELIQGFKVLHHSSIEDDCFDIDGNSSNPGIYTQPVVVLQPKHEI